MPLEETHELRHVMNSRSIRSKCSPTGMRFCKSRTRALTLVAELADARSGAGIGGRGQGWAHERAQHHGPRGAPHGTAMHADTHGMPLHHMLQPSLATRPLTMACSMGGKKREKAPRLGQGLTQLGSNPALIQPLMQRDSQALMKSTLAYVVHDGLRGCLGRGSQRAGVELRSDDGARRR